MGKGKTENRKLGASEVSDARARPAPLGLLAYVSMVGLYPTKAHGISVAGALFGGIGAGSYSEAASSTASERSCGADCARRARTFSDISSTRRSTSSARWTEGARRGTPRHSPRPG